MANAVAMSGASVQVIHATVYREARAGIPGPTFQHLTGDDPSEPAHEGNSFRQRAIDPYRFAEFLPCFAIRPVFNQFIYVLHYWLGLGLLKAVVVIPVVSYWLMGWVVFFWACRYVPTAWAALISSLTLLSPPLWELARSTTPDALSSLVVLLAMFLLFEKQFLLPGIILLMASVYVRTDNAVLVLLVLAYLFLADLGFHVLETATLAALAFASVFLINHFSGDYGPKVLFYRSFVEAPAGVGEIIPRFGLHEYLQALKLAIASVVHGYYIPFVLMGAVGVLRPRSRAIFAVVALTTIYTAAHIVIFPNPETRFFGPFFAAMGLALSSSISVSPVAQVAQLYRSTPFSTSMVPCTDQVAV
jgi:hypothetical protein